MPLALVPASEPPIPALFVEDVCKRYGDIAALSGIELEIASGEIVALLGANGAGKTTLMSIVAGLRRPDAGCVRVHGVDVLREPSFARANLGFAPQDTGIYPTLSVRENLHFFGELAGLRGRELRDRVMEIVDAVELERHLLRPAHALSGGEARRLHTAMTLMGRSPLLLLDEPTAGVDVHTRARLLAVVRRRVDEGSAVCYSTHYLPEVEQLAASVAIIDQGRIVARGTEQQLLSVHAQSFVELQFDGPAPELSNYASVRTAESTLRIATTEPPAVAAAAILTQLGSASQSVRAVKLIQPSLESVFLDVTNRPLPASEPSGQACL